MKVLFIGDIFGNGGKRAAAHIIPKLKAEFSPDFIIANGENMAGGRGITKNLAHKLFKFGVHCITSGNHIWNNQEGVDLLDQENRLLRPLNYPDGNPGKGSGLYECENGKKVGVLNLIGRVFLYNTLDPFSLGKKAVKELKEQGADIVIVDFHAEATSEKLAMGFYLDGLASAVLGTHTHVQTADERILPKGTGYITDVGFTGPMDSIIGVKIEKVIKKFLLQTPVRFEPSDKNLYLHGAIMSFNDQGLCENIQRVKEHLDE